MADLAASPTNRTTVFVWAIVALSVALLASIVTVAILRPGDTSTGTLLIGVIGPIITALLAGVLQSVHILVNSNTDKLKETIAQLEESAIVSTETIAALRATIQALKPAA